MTFPEDRKAISALNYDQKIEWYSTRNPQEMVFLGNNPDFQRFWKWHVMIPMKIKRFYYRVKNREIFKKYKPITEVGKKMKKYSI